MSFQKVKPKDPAAARKRRQERALLIQERKNLVSSGMWDPKTQAAWEKKWQAFKRRSRYVAPVRAYPIAVSPNDPTTLVVQTPKSDEIPDMTLWGNDGFADIYEDRIEFFFPALLAGGKMLAAAAAPKILSAGKALAGAALNAVSNLTSEEEEEEEEFGEEEEDSTTSGCKCGGKCGPCAAKTLPPPSAASKLEVLPIELKSLYSMGLFYDTEDGHYEFFFPAIAAALPALVGPIAGLLGGFRSKKQKKRERRKRQQEAAAQAEAERQAQLQAQSSITPGPGESPEVQAAILQQQTALLAQRELELEQAKKALAAEQAARAQESASEEEDDNDEYESDDEALIYDQGPTDPYGYQLPDEEDLDGPA